MLSGSIAKLERMSAQWPPVLRWTLRWAVLELWEGFYVRAGRSRSSRPPQTSASADAEPVRAQVAEICWVLIQQTLTEFLLHCKGDQRPREDGLA
jgi:hypothetical protein